MPFKAGNNLNPKGTKVKPKEQRVSTWILRELERLQKIDDSTMEGYEASISKAQKIAQQMVDRALKDDDDSLAYIKEVLDRTEGKPKQFNEVSGPDGDPISILLYKPEKSPDPDDN